MGSVSRVRLGSRGQAALLEMRGLATRILDSSRGAGADEALDVAARFIRYVDPRERERIVAAIRREVGGVRLGFPAGQGAGEGVGPRGDAAPRARGRSA